MKPGHITRAAMPEGFDDAPPPPPPPLPATIRQQFAEWGRAGGFAAKRRMSKAAMREKNRRAALIRWKRRKVTHLHDSVKMRKLLKRMGGKK